MYGGTAHSHHHSARMAPVCSRSITAHVWRHSPLTVRAHDVQNQVNYSPSVDIRPEWTVLEQIHFPLLQKLTLKVGEPVDVLKCGVLEYYDRATDRVTPKTAISLAKTHRAFRSVTTSDDKIMKKVALEGGARVFITDSILTALMCTPRSVYAWDIVITRKGNCIWFDKRPDSQVRDPVSLLYPCPLLYHRLSALRMAPASSSISQGPCRWLHWCIQELPPLGQVLCRGTCGW